MAKACQEDPTGLNIQGWGKGNIRLAITRIELRNNVARGEVVQQSGTGL